MHLPHGLLCIPSPHPLVSASLLTVLQFLSPTITITTSSLLLRALKQSTKGPCSPFPDLFKSRDEHYPHSSTPMGQASGPSSNHRPLHSQLPPQEPGAGTADGGCLWSSAGLQTHVGKEERTGKRGCQCRCIPVCGKAMLPCVATCTYKHGHTLKGPIHCHHPYSKAQGFPLPGVSTVRLAGASTWPKALRAKQR